MSHLYRVRRFATVHIRSLLLPSSDASMITSARRYSRALVAVCALLFVFVHFNAAAQDATWFSDITSATKLDSARSGQISATDINNDGYPDVLLLNISYNRSMKTRLYLNKQHPDSANPKARIFVDVTDESNMYENRDTSVKGRVADCWGMADLNNDGYPDLVSGIFYFNVGTFGDLGDRMEILLNDGKGRFNLVRNNGIEGVGEPGSTPPGKFPATSFCFLDYNLDGNLDIYVGTFSANHQSNIWLPGYLLKGNGDGTFTNVTDESGIVNVFEPTYGASVTDWNNDGWPDILTSPYCRTEGTLWRNEGDETFTNVTIEAGYSSKNGQYGNIDVGGSAGNWVWFPRELCQWEALPADFDNDGDMDIAQMLIHGGLDPGEGHSPLSINNGAEKNYSLTWDLNAFDRPLNVNSVVRRDTVKSDTSWTNQYGFFTLPKGSIVVTSANGHLGDQAGSWFDMDNDGLQDFLLSATGYDAANDRCYIQKQNADHSFTEIAQKLGLRSTLKETHSQRPFDLDADGDDDVLIEYAPRTANAQSGRVWMLRNNIGDKNSFTRIKLEAPAGCNRSGIGCRVYVYAGGVRQMRDVQSGVGRWGMATPLTLNFGLGSATSIDSVVVRWAMRGMPTTTIANPPINALLRIRKDGMTTNVPEELRIGDALSVAPLPARQEITVHVPSALQSDCTIELIDAFGNIVATYSRHGDEYVQLPLAGLASGMYIVRAHANGITAIKSFVKVD